MMHKTTSDQQDQDMLRRYLSAATPMQWEIARMYNLAQGTVSKHIFDAAQKYIEAAGIHASDPIHVRSDKFRAIGDDPDFGNRVYMYVLRRAAGDLSGVESRELRTRIFRAA